MVALVAEGPEPFDPRLLAGIDEAEPGVATLAALAGAEARDLTDQQRVDLALAAERLHGLVAAKQAELFAELPRPGAATEGSTGSEDWAVLEVSAAFHLSDKAAQERLWFARQLVGRFPRMHGLLAAGRVSRDHAAALVEACEVLDDDAAAEVEGDAVLKAPGTTLARFRRSLRRAVLRADATAAQKRRQQAVHDRRVERWDLDDGIAALYLVGPAEDIAAIYDCTSDLARQQQRDGSPLGLDALRFDTLRECVLGAWVTEKVPTHQGMPTMLHVHGRAATLAGLDDEPGHLDGIGPIPAPVLRQLAGLAETAAVPESRRPVGSLRWTVTSVDQTGRAVPRPDQEVDKPRDHYAPDTELRRYVTLRDRRCTFPGCGRPATHTDLDHADPWPDGPTSRRNLHAVCRRHHRAKTIGGWKVIAHPDESRTWISPHGREYLVRPPDQLDC